MMYIRNDTLGILLSIENEIPSSETVVEGDERGLWDRAHKLLQILDGGGSSR
jgi:hypothetical protein